MTIRLKMEKMDYLTIYNSVVKIGKKSAENGP